MDISPLKRLKISKTWSYKEKEALIELWPSFECLYKTTSDQQITNAMTSERQVLGQLSKHCEIGEEAFTGRSMLLIVMP